MIFVCSTRSNTTATSAYTHRVVQLERQCKKLGVDTELMFLGDYFFGSPVLIQPMNAPSTVRHLSEFDVIHAGGNGAAYAVGLWKPLLKRRPILLYDIHGDVLEESRTLIRERDIARSFSGFQMLLQEHVAIGRADYFIAASMKLKQRILGRSSVKEDVIEVVPNGVDLELFDSERTYEDSHSTCFTVTYAGSFLPWHGIENLIDAGEMLDGCDIRLKIIGFKKNDSALKESIRSRLGSKAELVDWLPRGALVAQLRQSDVLIIPADPRLQKVRDVASPTKFAEYAALGKPIIVTTVDGISESVRDFDCGIVCDPTSESIASAIRQARDMPKENLLRKGENARRLAEEQFDMDEIGDRYVKFLKRICS